MKQKIWIMLLAIAITIATFIFAGQNYVGEDDARNWYDIGVTKR